MTVQADNSLSVGDAITRFLTAMEGGHRSPYTLRDYATDLKRFADFYQGSLQEITAMTLDHFLFSLAYLRPVSQARKRAALSSFLRWAQQEQLIEKNPMADVPYIHTQRAPAPPLKPQLLQQILRVIPPEKLRDQLIFRLIGELGLRAGEVLALQVEDIDLTQRPLYTWVQFQGIRQNKSTPVSLGLDAGIRQYLAESGYQNGPLFRGQKKGREVPLQYQAVYYAWINYCKAAGVSAGLHELRVNAPGRFARTNRVDEWIPKLLSHHTDRLTYHYVQSAPLPREQEFQNRKFVPVHLDLEAVQTEIAAQSRAWRYAEVEAGYCTHVFYERCPHRLLCPCCDFFCSAEQLHPSLTEDKERFQLIFQALNLSTAERNMMEQKPGAKERLREQLADVPTPAGPTPRQLQSQEDPGKPALTKGL